MESVVAIPVQSARLVFKRGHRKKADKKVDRYRYKGIFKIFAQLSEESPGGSVAFGHGTATDGRT
jgi:hypothetical protein